MPARDWERIKTVFEKAQEVPEPELERFLDTLCDGDRSMVDFVRSLVRNHRDETTGSGPEPRRVFTENTLIAQRFRVVRFIASGAMGEVYEVHDQRLSQRVALKTMRTELVRSPDTLSRFEREIRMAREVSHPNLCRVFDYLEGGPSYPPCYTMELIDGESLAAFIVRERPLSVEAALPLARQIALGLDALHTRGIVHRDLKPSNIMLARDTKGALRVVLMDFGLAKLLNSEDELFQTHVGPQMGAPYFMAPELLREGQPSVASDLYAYGLIVDEMVTRTRAFSAQSLQSLYFAKLWEAPIPPQDRADSLPLHWHGAILTAISPEPEQRYPNAGDMITALENPAPLVQLPAPARLPPWRPRLKLALAPIVRRPRTTAATFAAMLALGLFSALTAPDPATPTVHVYDIENVTGNPALNYLCSGASNELIRRLTRIEGIRVVPMRAMRKADRVSAEAGVSIEGMLAGSGDQVRLTVLLTDNRTGETFDSEKIEQKAGNWLKMENELAAITVNRLQSHIAQGAGPLRSAFLPFIPRLGLNWFHPLWEQVVSAPTSSGAAFDSYIRGRQLIDDYSQASMEAALPYLRRAVEQDPKFALGYAALAEARLNSMTFARTPQQSSLEAARRDAEHAIQLDPSLAEAHAAQAYVYQAEWDWRDAEAHFQKALSLKPGYASARRKYAGLLMQFGRVDEAMLLAQQAYSEDPYDRGSIPGIGMYYYLAGRYEDSIRFLETQIGESDMQGARHNLGDALAEAGATAQQPLRAQYFTRALDQAAKVTAIERRSAGADGYTPMGDEMYSHYLTLMGNYAAAEPYFQRFREELSQGLASPALVAWIYALRGEKDTAITLLEQAYAARDRRLLYLRMFPALASLRGEARFQAIVAQMKL